jgi:hypothetical protein
MQWEVQLYLVAIGRSNTSSVTNQLVVATASTTARSRKDVGYDPALSLGVVGEVESSTVNL